MLNIVFPAARSEARQYVPITFTMWDAGRDAIQKLDDYVREFSIDDSSVPYFQLAIGFMVVEYVFHTYLDMRQRKVRSFKVLMV
jgi:hypothetical protein